MLYLTSTKTMPADLLAVAHEEGLEYTGRRNGYLYQNDDVSFPHAAQTLTAEHPMLYAIELADGLIKLGITTDLAGRWRQLKSTHGATRVLAISPGTQRVERAIRRRLKPHRAHGQTYYRPTPEVLDLINSWRRTLGRPAIT